MTTTSRTATTSAALEHQDEAGGQVREGLYEGRTPAASQHDEDDGLDRDAAQDFPTATVDLAGERRRSR